MNSKSMLVAAGVAGVIMGLIAALPFINFSTWCCCLWVGLWGCGVLAVWIYRASNATAPGLSVGQSAVLGLVTGLVGALVFTILSGITTLLFAGLNTASITELMNQYPELADSIPVESQDMMQQFVGAGAGWASGAFCTFVIHPLFAMLGSVIGTSLIWKK